MYECVRYGSLTPSEKGYGEMSFKQEKKTNKVDELSVGRFGPLILKTVSSWDPGSVTARQNPGF